MVGSNDELSACPGKIIPKVGEDFCHLRGFDRIAQAIGAQQVNVAVFMRIEVHFDFDAVGQPHGARNDVFIWKCRQILGFEDLRTQIFVGQ